MAQVDVGIQFNDLDNINIINIDSGIGVYDEISIPEFSFSLDNKIYLNSEAVKINVENIFNDYTNMFSVDTATTTEDEYGFDFSSLNVNIKARSGACSEVSFVKEYFFRAYHKNLNTYVFWSAGVKDFSQIITGYNPNDLENIAILFIKY